MKTEPNDAAFSAPAYTDPESGRGQHNTHARIPGLTKREYFALIAMQGILSNYQNFGIDDRTTIEMLAVKKADALIAELNNP